LFGGGLAFLFVFVLTDYAAAQTTVTVDLDSLDTSSGEVYGVDLDAYMANFGITITDVIGDHVSVRADALNGGEMNVVASSPPNILQPPYGSLISYTLEFDTPLDSFSFTRTAYCTYLAFPPWEAVAKDVDGNVLDTISEGASSTNASCDSPSPPAMFTFSTAGIKSVTLNSGHYGFYGRTGPALDDLTLTFTSSVIDVPLDIKPQSCPNPLNVKSKGVLPIAILGTEDFDVTEIDLASIRLAGVAPIRSSIEDVSTPLLEKEDECDCTTEGEDEIDDLTLKFDTQEIVDALGEVADGDVFVLTLTGELSDGTPIEGEDCIIILSKGKVNNE
jgi:hypothetical protein